MNFANMLVPPMAVRVADKRWMRSRGLSGWIAIHRVQNPGGIVLAHQEAFASKQWHTVPQKIPAAVWISILTVG